MKIGAAGQAADWFLIDDVVFDIRNVGLCYEPLGGCVEVVSEDLALTDCEMRAGVFLYCDQRASFMCLRAAQEAEFDLQSFARAAQFADQGQSPEPDSKSLAIVFNSANFMKGVFVEEQIGSQITLV